MHDLKQIELLDITLAISPGVARASFQRVDFFVLGDRPMLKQWTAVLTAFTLLHCSNVAMAQTAPEKGAGRERETPAEQVGKIKPGQKMEVRLTNGQKLRGRLVRVTAQGLDLRTVEAGHESVQSVAFQDVELVKKRGWPLWAKIGVGYAICMTILLILFHDFSV